MIMTVMIATGTDNHESQIPLGITAVEWQRPPEKAAYFLPFIQCPITGIM